MLGPFSDLGIQSQRHQYEFQFLVGQHGLSEPKTIKENNWFHLFSV